MGKSKRVPAIRFKGFTEEWEEKELGDCADIVGGGTPSTSVKEYWGGDINWYSPAEIGNNTFIQESQRKITELGLKNSSATILPVGTVLFSSRAGIGNTAILTKEAATNQGFQSIIPNKNKLDSYFIFSRTNELKKYGEVNGAGSTFIEVSGKQMSCMPIFNPELAEQKQIGEFFQNVDNLINANQRKLDKLKNIKKACLEKMFPRKGSTIPEIRFKGFTEEWESKSLDQIGNRFDNLRIPITAQNRIPGETPYYGANGIQDYVEGFTHDGEFILIAEDGANDLLNYPVQYVTGKIWVNNHTHVFQGLNNIVDNLFLKYTVSQTDIKSLLVGGSRAKLNAETMMKIEVIIPKYFNEQLHIASFFKNLDNLIAKNEQQLEKLKNIKKACLEKMFVNKEDAV